MLPDLLARFAAMRSPWRSLVPPSVVFATKTVFNMLQYVNPGLCFFLARRRPNANYNHSFARIVGASRGAATAPVARPRENPQGEPLRRTPGATKPTIFMRKLPIFMRKLIYGEGGGRNRPQESEEHPQRTPQKALFKHASSSTVPSPVGFADTLVGAWPAEPVVKSPEAAFVGVHWAAAAAEEVGPRR